jgi:hypothetical protein
LFVPTTKRHPTTIPENPRGPTVKDRDKGGAPQMARASHLVSEKRLRPQQPLRVPEPDDSGRPVVAQKHVDTRAFPADAGPAR